jgi:tRNA(fMet)-specific endonuclease VapC
MLQFLFDTDRLTLYDHGQAAVVQKYHAQPADAVVVSAVTIQEYLRGRLAALTRHPSGPLHVQAYSRLVASVRLLQKFPTAPYDQAAETQVQQFRASRIRVGTQDLKIAAVALVNHLTLVTRNRRDFSRIPGLVLDDWSM